MKIFFLICSIMVLLLSDESLGHTFQDEKFELENDAEYAKTHAGKKWGLPLIFKSDCYEKWKAPDSCSIFEKEIKEYQDIRDLLMGLREVRKLISKRDKKMKRKDTDAVASLDGVIKSVLSKMAKIFEDQHTENKLDISVDVADHLKRLIDGHKPIDLQEIMLLFGAKLIEKTEEIYAIHSKTSHTEFEDKEDFYKDLRENGKETLREKEEFRERLRKSGRPVRDDVDEDLEKDVDDEM